MNPDIRFPVEITSEAVMARVIISLARSAGLLAHHCADSRKCEGDRGFPDLVILGTRGVLLAELKMTSGETSASQDEWAWRLTQVDSQCGPCCERGGVLYKCYRPDDLTDGTVARDLGELA